MHLKQAVSEDLPAPAGQLDGGEINSCGPFPPELKPMEARAKCSGMREHTGSLAPGWSGYQALEQQEQASREGGQQLAQDQGQGA